jgi:hypothetical protein
MKSPRPEIAAGAVAQSEAQVRFRLRDVYLPPANELLAALCGDRVLQGEVVARSRSEGDAACVVVKVEGLEQLLVVSADNLLAVP